jgi:hypothetical protein
MALVAYSKMSQHQCLENAMERTRAANDINHLASIPKVYPDGSGIRATPDATFSVANLHVNRLPVSNGENARRGRPAADIAQSIGLLLPTDTVAKLFCIIDHRFRRVGPQWRFPPT